MNYINLILIISLVILKSCGGVQMLSSSQRTDLYGKEFLDKINQVKILYSKGETTTALTMLQGVQEEGLNNSEKSMRRNLTGVIFFSKENYEQAIFNFEQALATSQEDPNLTARIRLNLASSYYKLNMTEKAYETIKEAPENALTLNELVKFHQLKYQLAQAVGDDPATIRSLFFALSLKKNISELKVDPLYEILQSKLRSFDQRQKYIIFEEFEKSKPLVVGYMAYLEAEKLYYSGEKSKAEDLVRWLEDNFESHPEIASMISDFSYRIENYAKLDPQVIGVILPLSGEKESFGKRALLGIDASLRNFKKKNPKAPEYKIIVRDSNGSGVVGAHQARELVEKHYASVIIGGLFSLEATKEYELAKRLGVFFVSLSQIYLKKEEKDHLLLEVPGSIESQVSQLFTSSIRKNFGERAAIVYPKSKRGKAYVDEFWRKALLENIKVTGVYSYESTTSDFRDPIKNLLGLKYPRTRKEELEILQEVYSLEKSSSIRRIQTLRPKMDFDWVFIPAFPLEAVQIIPSFTYYDAFNVPIVGGPSWRSNRLSQESYKFKNIHFVGDDVAEISQSLMTNFQSNYGKKMKLIELRSFDSMTMALNAVFGKKFSSREELDSSIRSLGSIRGNTGEWVLTEGIWIKKMANLHFKNGKINELLTMETESEVEQQDDSVITKSEPKEGQLGQD